MSVRDIILGGGSTVVPTGYWLTGLSQASANMKAIAVVIDSSGNSYMTCYNDGSTNGTGYVVKLNSNGGVVWQQAIDNLYPASIAISSDGTLLVIGGQYIPSSSSDNTVALVGMSSEGVMSWNKLVHAPGNQPIGYVADVIMDSSNNFYICGPWSASGYTSGVSDIFLARFNSSGTMVWNWVLGASTSDTGWSLATNNSSLFMQCTYNGVTALFSFDLNGNYQWGRYASNVTSNVEYNGAGCCYDSSSGYILWSPTRHTTAAINTSGTQIWQKYDTIYNQGVFTIAAAGGYNYTWKNAVNDDGGYDLAKRDSAGNYIWSSTLNATGNLLATTNPQIAVNSSAIWATLFPNDNKAYVVKIRTDASDRKNGIGGWLNITNSGNSDNTLTYTISSLSVNYTASNWATATTGPFSTYTGSLTATTTVI